MVRVLDVKGIPIICLKDDSRVGYVSVPLYDEYNCVCGFLAEVRGFSFRKKYIALDDILRIDRNSCVIYSENSIRNLPKAMHWSKAGELDRMLGRNVISRDGTGLGVVKDLVFDLETGNIEGFELSRGYMEDVVQGRPVILLRDGVEFGEEYIIAGRGDEHEG